MKTSETKNNTEFNSSEWTTQEELERLIELAPTAIHRQALQQQLAAMEKVDKAVEETDVSDKQDDVTVESTNDLAEQNDAIVDKSDALIDKEKELAEKAAQNEVVVEPTDADLLVDQEKEIVEITDPSVKQDNITVAETSLPAQQNDVDTNDINTIVEPAEVDLFVEQDKEVFESANLSVEQDDTIVEKTGMPVESDGVMAEEADLLVEEDKETIANVEPSFEQDYVNPEKTEESVKEDEMAVEKASVLAETNDATVEEGVLLKQGKQPDKFYVAMGRKSRLSPLKMTLLATAVVILILVSVVTWIRPGMSTSTDGIVAQIEILQRSMKDAFAQLKSMIWAGDSVESPASMTEFMAATVAESQDAILKMYEAKSVALDSLLKFDDFIEVNRVPLTQQIVEIKARLQLAQSQQQTSQYYEATDSYRRVSSELESLMTMNRQLITKKDAAELARLNWESYRWKLYLDAQNLSLTPQESTLIELENKIIMVAQQGEGGESIKSVVQQVLTGYKEIEHGYVELLDGVKEVAKTRALVDSRRQQWRQFRDEYNLDDKAIVNIEKAYSRGAKLELAGSFQEAIKSYQLADEGYVKALEDVAARVDKRNKSEVQNKE